MANFPSDTQRSKLQLFQLSYLTLMQQMLQISKGKYKNYKCACYKCYQLIMKKFCIHEEKFADSQIWEDTKLPNNPYKGYPQMQTSICRLLYFCEQSL